VSQLQARRSNLAGFSFVSQDVIVEDCFIVSGRTNFREPAMKMGKQSHQQAQ
jgi:hypothetical protein